MLFQDKEGNIFREVLLPGCLQPLRCRARRRQAGIRVVLLPDGRFSVCTKVVAPVSRQRSRHTMQRIFPPGGRLPVPGRFCSIYRSGQSAHERRHS